MQQNPGPIAKLLYRVPEACEATGLSRTTLYALLAAGELKAIHVNSAVRIPADELAAWVERKRAESREALAV